MRIWWQSSIALGADPAWKPYQESLKNHVQQVAKPDTRVDVYGVKFVEPILGRSSYVRYLNEAQVINNAIVAEREGYDAFCVGCTLDPGIAEIKEIIDIPAAFLFESCAHLASILAGKFSLLAFNKEVLRYHEQLVRHYDLAERLVPCDTLMNLTSVDLTVGFKNPDPFIAAVKEAGRKAIDQGTGMFISTCNILNMVLVNSGFREIDGVPILDTAGALLKVTELMVNLKEIGISRSKKGFYSTLPKEDLIRIRKSYGIE